MALAIASEPAAPASAVSALRAWLFLIWFNIQRQAKTTQMIWIALILLAFSVTLVALNTAADRWGKDHWRMPRRSGATFQQWLDATSAGTATVTARTPTAAGLSKAVLSAAREVLRYSSFHVFTQWVVFSIFLSFLLPIWTLSFSQSGLGGERESGSLQWTLLRPLPRSAVYAGHYIAVLPWVLGFNLGGFGLICLAAGWPGTLAFRLFWPAVAGTTLTFAALFLFFAACFQRAGVVGMVYVFFFETLVGNMPGTMKRLSVTYYTRCLMFDAAGSYGVLPEKPTIFLPVSGTAAWTILIGATLALFLAGALVFARSEYQSER